MAWSTRQLAELANTTVNAVRHYHKIGLLDLPERGSNGYKHYGVPHLLRLLQIKRLTDLGIPLAQVAAIGRTDADADDEIRNLQAELESTIKRLTEVHAELTVLLHHRAPADTPPGFAPISHRLSDNQRAMLAVYSTIFDEATLEEFRQAVGVREETDDEFERLPADADDAAIELLAERMVQAVRRTQQNHPRLMDSGAHSPHGALSAAKTVGHALVALYNPAQLRVLQRLDALLTQEKDN